MLNNNTTANKNIKVMVVDDSVLIRKYISKIIDDLPGLEMITTAPNGKIGIQKLFLYKPDVIILDIEMPELNGIDFLRYVKANCAPAMRPHIIICSSLVGEGSSVTFEALSLGASDFIKKPEGKISESIEYMTHELDIKIKELYKTRKLLSRDREEEKDTTGLSLEEKKYLAKHKVSYGISELNNTMEPKRIHPQIIAIGSSTGGPNSIRKIFNTLGALPVPMVIAQHMPAGFTFEFAKNLSKMFNRRVEEVKDKQILENGVIYIAPGGFHARIQRSGTRLMFQKDEKDYDGFFFKPSTDIFFRSIYESVGKDILGIVLSGMGHDGSIESVKLRKSGALLVAQDKKSSVVWGMPGNSVKNGGIDIIIDIDDIGEAINRVISHYL